MAAAARKAEPLNGFRHLQTSNLAMLQQAVGQYYPGAKFEIGSKKEELDALANRCRLQDTALTYGRHGTRLRIQIPDLDAYSLLCSFNGSATACARGTRVQIAGDHALMASAGESVDLDYSAEFEQLILYVAPGSLVAKLEALIGEPTQGHVIFKAAVDFRRPAAQNLRQLFTLLLRQADQYAIDCRPPNLAELEQAAIVALLTAIESNYSQLLSRCLRSAAPLHVRRAETYIEANWDQPLTIEALSLVTGVSARSLFHSFRKTRGYSPMDFVKRIRLDQAKKMLSDGSEASVTAVAFACGFGNLGHFATYYRRAFGESPSETLKRSP